MSDTQRQVAAGWYPDPNGTPNQRWWDGTQWTNHYAPPTAVAKPKLSGIALAGFICSTVAALMATIPGGSAIIPVIIGLILSHVSLRETKHGRKGRGFSVAGIVIGWCALAVILSVVVAKLTS
jgi:hypothetical protein